MDFAIRRMLRGTIKSRVRHFHWMDVPWSVITELLALGNKRYIIARIAGHQETMTTIVYSQVDVNNQINVMDALIVSRGFELNGGDVD